MPYAFLRLAVGPKTAVSSGEAAGVKCSPNADLEHDLARLSFLFFLFYVLFVCLSMKPAMRVLGKLGAGDRCRRGKWTARSWRVA